MWYSGLNLTTVITLNRKPFPRQQVLMLREPRLVLFHPRAYWRLIKTPVKTHYYLITLLPI